MNSFRESEKVSEELKKELLHIQSSTFQHGPDCSLEEISNNIIKFYSSEYRFFSNGFPANRDQYIQVCEFLFPFVSESSVHGHKFFRVGDTIVVRGLFDRIDTAAGTKTEYIDTYFCDTFAKQDGKWLLQTTIWIHDVED